MNFHKTIGFLATLLLVLGLGVPDSFAQDPTVSSVTLTLNGTAADPPTPAVTLADNSGTTVVTIAVTVSYTGGTLDADDTVPVTVSLDDDTNAEATDYISEPALTSPLVITATATSDGSTDAVGSRTLILTPRIDDDTDDENIVLEASVGDQMDQAIVQLTDSEVGIASVALTLNGSAGDAAADPPTPAVTFADDDPAQTVAIAVVVTTDEALPQGETRTVMVDAKPKDGYSTVPGLPVSLTVTGDGIATAITVSTNIALTPQADGVTDTDDEDITFEATVENSAETSKAILRITDSDNSVTAIALTLNGQSDGSTATFTDDAGPQTVAVTVTLTLEEALPATETRTVTVSVNTDDSDAEPGDYSTAPTLPLILTGSGDGSTAVTLSTNIVVTPATDADEMDEKVVLTATVENSDMDADATLNITDSDNSVTSVVLTLNGNAGTDDGTPAVTFGDNIGATIVTVGVTVTLRTATDAGDTDTRTVMVDLGTGGTADDGDYTISSLPLSIAVTVAGGATTGSGTTNIVLTPARDTDDDDENVVLEASVGGQMDQAVLLIDDSGVDPDPVAGAVTSVMLSPDMLSLTEGMAFTGMVTVTVNVEAGLPATHNVVLTPDGATLADLGITSPVAVEIAQDATMGTATVSISYTPPEDDNSTGEMITITGMVGTVGGDDNTTTLNIADNDMGAVTSIAFDPDMLSLSEGMAFTGMVTVTVNAVAGPAQTISVALSSSVPLPLGTINSPIAVEIEQDETMGTAEVSINYTPPQDDNSANEMITITGMAGGQSGTLELNVVDDDMGAVQSVAFDPDMLSLTEGTAFSGTVTVTVNVVAGAAADHVVALSSAPVDLGLTSPITVSVAAGASSGMATVPISYTPPSDANLDDEMITVTAAVGAMSDVLTLNIDDTTPSMGDIKVSTNLQSIRENSRTRNVVVTAELDAAPATGTTVMVNIMVAGGTAPVSTQIPIVGPATSGTATVAITPVNDDVFSTKSFTVTGSVTGYRSGMASIDIVDDEPSTGTIKITAAPPSLTVGTGSNTVTLTINVIGQTDTPEGTLVTVSLSTDAGTLDNDNVVVKLTNDPNKDPATYKTQTRTGADRGTAKLTVTAPASPGEVATVTGTAVGYAEGKRTISALSRDASDIAGYRVLITKPGAGAWAAVGDKKVVVEIARLSGIAYPWTAFGSIRVSLTDTTSNAPEVADALTVSAINDDNGTITFTKAGTKGKVSYVAATDRLKFELQISNNNAPRGNPDTNSEGQYMGVYAVADFMVGSTTTRLTNRQTDTPVYPNAALLASLVPNAADRYVGDGILIKVDTVKPDNAAITAVVVTSGDEVGADIDATVGDELRLAVGVATSGRLFRHSGMQAQLRVRANSARFMGRPISPTIELAQATVNYTPLQIITAARSSDSLHATWKVTEGFFKSEVDDFIEGIGPDGTRFVVDNAKAYVRVRVKDQANNWSGWKNSPIFDADSRSPNVGILYPATAPDSAFAHTNPLHFTGAVANIVEGRNVDEHLNPLRVVVDEELSALQVFAVGSDTLDLTVDGNIAGDSTLVYDTSMLNSPVKDGEAGTDEDKHPDTDYVPSSANRAGTKIELVVLATDMLGNTGRTSPISVTHDASPPVITDWFPKNSLLPEGQINDETPPVFTLSEEVDSIAVTFEGSDGSEVTRNKQRGVKGEDSIDISGALTNEISYDMTIFVRDLAGNVFITPADSSSNMRFNAEFNNPEANRFNISTETDSVIAGQANILTIQAEDHDAGDDVTRNALTYKEAARISAWDADGGAAESVWFEGTGVADDADSPDGVAMLSAADWRIGKRTVTVKSNKATGFIKILVQHVTSGQGDTAVLGFESAVDSLYVGAADFVRFKITAEKDGEVFKHREEVQGVNVGDKFILRVVPVDRYNNPSVRAFKPAEDGSIDSLSILDTRVKDSGAYEYKEGFDITVRSSPEMKGLPSFEWRLDPEGWPFTVEVPGDQVEVQVRIDNTTVHSDDMRSQNTRTPASFTFAAPLTPKIAASETGDVTIPVDGEAMVTVTASGYNAGSMVTFTKTKNGTAMDPVTKAADDDGNATLDITMAEAGTVTVLATDGRYKTDELTITFTDTPAKPMRIGYYDANGDPVYLILISDTDDMTVGVDDFLAFVAAYGSSDGDDNYNLQADVDDDGDVDIDDFLTFITSYNRTAGDIGPATKPIVLLPGINENAEFSLSLGSERVVAGELVAVDVSLANVAALVGYGFALNYESDKFEFVSVAPADEDLLKSTGGETLFHHIVSDGQITVANGLYNGTAVSGGGGVVQFVFRVLREFEDNARFEIADGLVFDPSQLQNPAVVAGVLELQSTPREFALHQNFPNPFNPDTTIKYDLAESADVTLQIYNVLGQVVRTLVASEAQNAGRYQIRWNGMDDRGVPVSSGIYFYQISADGKFSDVRKLMLLK